MAFTAAPSATPGARLNETVVAGNCPIWLIRMGVDEFLKLVNAIRGTGAPVVVCTVEPARENLAVTCTRLDASADEIALTAAINAELDRRIRLSPERWLWMHPRFDAN